MLDFSQYKCEYCGKTCTQVVFAAFLCDSPECVEKAYLARGGPGGHMKRRAEGKPIVPEEVCKAEPEPGPGPNDD